MILALDLAKKTGFCYLTMQCTVQESGVKEFWVERGESKGIIFVKYRAWLHQMLSLPGIALVGYEIPHLRGGATTELLVGFQTRVMEIAAEKDLPYVGMHTGRLKKLATGSGSASKPQMISQAARVLGRRPIDDNEADAVLLAMVLLHQYGAGLTPAAQQSLKL